MNVAKNQPTWQSSSERNFTSHKAVDGKFVSHPPNGKSVMYTLQAKKELNRAVSSCTDRTSSVNKLSIIWQKQKQFSVTSRISSVFVSFN